MAYLVVSNVGEIPLSGIRVLGLSKKSKEQIGQFGTGLKESIALMVRRGKKPVIFSGLNRIDFDTIMIEGNDEICFQITGTGTERFPSEIWHGMGMSPNFGKLDWTSAWQVLREIFCNAYDEGGMQHNITANLQGESGYTKIYLEVDEIMMKDYKSLPEKLLFLGHVKPLEMTSSGNILAKGNENKMKIFTKGVWVQTGAYPSLFDYEIKDLKLNESRSADMYSCLVGMAEIVNQSPMAIRQILTEANENKDFKHFSEGDHFSYFLSYGVTRANWKNQFIDLYGVTAVAICTQHHLEIVSRKGYKPVVFEEGIYSTLKDLGIPTASTILTADESDGTQILANSIKSIKLFDKIWMKFNKEGLTKGKIKPELKTFSMIGSEGSDLKLGFYRSNCIHINSRIIGSREEIITMLEEIAHHCSDASDCSRDFQNYLFDCLVTLNF